jgi:hypothetical protein
MILELGIKFLIGHQLVQYSGKYRLKIVSIPRAGLLSPVIPLELASPFNLPHSAEPSIPQRWPPKADRRAGPLP